jgi:PAS domain S-box-containing protein
VTALEQSRLIERSIELPFKETAPETGPFRFYADGMEAGSETGWEKLFWFVFNESTNPMCLIDSNRRVVELNEPTLALLQRNRMEVVGSPADDFLAPSDRPDSQRRWHRILQLDTGEFHGIGTILRADGEEVALEFAARMIRLTGRRLAVYVLVSRGRVPSKGVGEGTSKSELTERERQVVTAIAMGDTTPDIAKELHISPETVRTHVRNAMEKTNTRTRAHLVARVMGEEGLLHLPHLEEQT